MSEKNFEIDILKAEKFAEADIKAEEPEMFGESGDEGFANISKSIKEAQEEGQYVVSEEGSLIFQEKKDAA